MTDSIINRIRPVSEPYPYPVRDWPPQAFYHDALVTRLDLERLNELINAGASETEIDAYLRGHPSTLAFCRGKWSTGHHASWIIPQQEIRPTLPNATHGLKPDYLLGGKNSGGITWHVLELKSPSDKVFVRNSKGRLKFSETAHEGMFQLLEYIDYCASAQSYLRDTLGLTGFREPTGLLVIGRLEEFEDTDHQAMKAAWKRLASDRLQITTYDSLLGGIKGFVEWQEEQRS